MRNKQAAPGETPTHPPRLAGGGIALCAIPGQAFADVCSSHRPDWDGTPVTGWTEALSLLSSPAVLFLIAATLVVVRLRSQWGALAVVSLWSVLVAVLAFAPKSEVQRLALQEGCAGPPTIFIALAVAVCAALILYTVPRPKDPE